jgi:anti-sigma-K factor RskA
MMSHEEAKELLEVLALNAVDADVAAQIEEHVATCPRCQSELDSLRAVAAALGNSVDPLPEGVWTNISNQLWERKGDEQELPELIMPAAGAEVVTMASSRAARTRRMRNGVSALGAVAAALIVVLAVSLSGANHHVANLQNALQLADRTAVQKALATPGHQLVDLSNSAQQPIAKIVMLPNGNGYLVSSHMPKLASNQTYQLWGIVKGSPVSIGVMGDAPGHVTFTMASTPAPSELAVTVQNAGGSLTPSTTFVATGTV